jgi:hypothetical protein
MIMIDVVVVPHEAPPRFVEEHHRLVVSPKMFTELHDVCCKHQRYYEDQDHTPDWLHFEQGIIEADYISDLKKLLGEGLVHEMLNAQAGRYPTPRSG